MLKESFDLEEELTRKVIHDKWLSSGLRKRLGI